MTPAAAAPPAGTPAAARAPGSPSPSQTPFEPSLTLGPRVVEGVHRHVREHVEVGLGTRAREHVLEGRAEVLEVDGPVGHEQELGERELALAEDPEGAGHGLAAVALLDDGRGQRVIAGLAVGPEARRTPGITSGKSGESSSCSRSPMKKSSCRGLPDDGRGVDRVAPVREWLDLEDRVVVAQRVVAVVVAEGALGPAQLGGTRPTSANSAVATSGCGPGPGARAAGARRR